MNRNWKKLLSLLLVLTMLVGMMPAVFAADEEPEAEPEEQTDVLPAEEPADEEPEDPDEPAAGEEPVTPEEPETPEAPAESDPSVAPEDPADPTDPADPGAIEDPEEPEVPEESEEGAEAEEEPVEEEEEPAELPCGFPGMGEGYELSEEELAAKLAMADLPAIVAAMTPGVDYVAGELLFLTGSADYAQQVADAYNAELLYCDELFGRIRLREATVLQAVECAADPEIPLPAVEPNYLTSSGTVPAESVSSDDFAVQGERMDREMWGYTEPWIVDPSDSRHYQYHHDILGDYEAWGAAMGTGITVAVVSYNYGAMASALIADGVDGVDGLGVAPNATVKLFTPEKHSAEKYVIQLENVYADTSCRIVLVDGELYVRSSALYEVIDKLLSDGRVVIAPMGTNGSNYRCWPAAYDGVIAVGASTPDGNRAAFSNYGDWCDISAPGVAPSGNPYHYSGTSYSAALVAGAAALYAQVYGIPALAGFEAAMKSAAVKGGIGAGILNTARLFGEAPGVPTYWGVSSTIWDDTYDIPCVSMDGILYFMADGKGENIDFVYTLDGKTPAMKDGRVAVGKRLAPSDGVMLSSEDLEFGKVYTLNIIAVNGLGIPGKVGSQKFKVVESAMDVVLNITSPSMLTGELWLSAGGSYTLKAEVISSHPVSGSVVWSIDEQINEAGFKQSIGAKIDPKTGKLTTKAGMAGELIVSASYKAYDDTLIQTVKVNVQKTAKIKKLTTDVSAVTLDAGSYSMPFTVTATDEDGFNITDYPTTKFCWTSSNENVVVPADPLYEGNQPDLHAVGKGVATVKGTAMDGSGKSVSIKVTVRQPVIGVDLFFKDPDQAVLAPGGTVQLTAKIYPDDADNKDISWELNHMGMPGVTLKNGVLKMKKGSSVPSNYVKVTARSKDNPTMYFELKVDVCSPAESISVKPFDSSDLPFPGSDGYDKSGNLNMITLFSCDLPTTGNNEAELSLDMSYLAGGISYSTFKMSSDKPGIANVSGGKILAGEPGNCKVTLCTADGLVSHVIKVKVIRPVSGFSIRSAAPGGTNTVAYGKRIKLQASPLSAFGKPSDAKLQWKVVAIYDGSGINITSTAKKDVTIKNGTVTVEKTAAASDVRRIQVRVEPANYAVGYPCLFEDFFVYVTDPISSISITYYGSSFTGLELTDLYEFDAGCEVTLNGGTLYCPSGSNALITLTSSNPGLLNVFPAQEGGTGGSKYALFLEAYPEKLPAFKPKTVKITVTANDGSGKTASFNVTVQNTSNG